MALQVQPQLLTGRTVRERNVVVGNVVEEMDLLLGQQDPGGDRVDGGVAPALVEETAILVQRAEVIDILVGPQPVQAANLEV